MARILGGFACLNMILGIIKSMDCFVGLVDYIMGSATYLMETVN
jgi:hypothetical protein